MVLKEGKMIYISLIRGDRSGFVQVICLCDQGRGSEVMRNRGLYRIRIIKRMFFGIEDEDSMVFQ